MPAIKMKIAKDYHRFHENKFKFTFISALTRKLVNNAGKGVPIKRIEIIIRPTDKEDLRDRQTAHRFVNQSLLIFYL